MAAKPKKPKEIMKVDIKMIPAKSKEGKKLLSDADHAKKGWEKHSREDLGFEKAKTHKD